MTRGVPTPRVERTCGHCAQTFLVAPWDIKMGGGKFCSQMCFKEAAKVQPLRGVCVTPKPDKSAQIRAHGLINSRVRRGAIARPDACTQCGKVGRVDGHHEDPENRPADGEWLCRSCHMKRHHKPRSQAS
jgi:hypothetical protein